MKLELLRSGSARKTVSSRLTPRLKWILFAWLVAVVGTASTVHAAVYYVAIAGSDSNSGGSSSPFRTVKKGISILKPGDTLYVRAGNYGESVASVSQIVPAGTSWSSPITIAAYPGEVVTLRRIGLWNSSIRYLIFDGFVLDAQGLNEGIYLSEGANHIRFRNCEVKGAKGQGVLVTNRTGATNFNEFINLKVHDNGTTYSQDHGLYISTSYNLVQNCEVYANAAYGICVYNGYAGQRADGNVVRGNRVHDNSTLGAGSGIVASSGSGNSVYNNVVWNHRGAGIEIGWRNPVNTRVYHNTTCKNGVGINVVSGSSGTTVGNNIVYSNTYALINQGTGTSQFNNLASDPSFVNQNYYDYRLRSGSRAINAGILLSEVLVDLLGVARPQGSGVDIGAYEYK
jgi:hypothetical protein